MRCTAEPLRVGSSWMGKEEAGGRARVGNGVQLDNSSRRTGRKQSRRCQGLSER